MFLLIKSWMHVVEMQVKCQTRTTCAIQLARRYYKTCGRCCDKCGQCWVYQKHGNFHVRNWGQVILYFTSSGCWQEPVSVAQYLLLQVWLVAKYSILPCQNWRINSLPMCILFSVIELVPQSMLFRQRCRARWAAGSMRRISRWLPWRVRDQWKLPCIQCMAALRIRHSLARCRDAVVTPAFKLPSKYVMHAVGPQGEKPKVLSR